MNSQQWCTLVRSPLSMGDAGERLGDEFWMIRDAVELEDESASPAPQFGDALESGLDLVGEAFDQVQRAHAFMIENLHRAHDTYVRSRDAVLAHSNATSHAGGLSDDQAMERSFAAEVAVKIGVTDRVAETMTHEAITLVEDLPELMDAFRVGFTSYQHARAAARQAWSVPAEARAEFDAAIVDAARTQTPTRFTQTVRKTREKLHPESIQERKNAEYENRRVDHEPADDGMAYVSLYHSADVISSIVAQASARSRALRAAGDSRTLRQIEADLIAEACRTGISAPADSGNIAGDAVAIAGDMAENDDDDVDQAIEGHAPAAGDADSGTVTLTRAQLNALRPGVVITVPALSLLGRSSEPAELAGYGPIDPETATTLIGQATSFIRVLTDPISGAHRYTDPNKYRLSEKMKRAIRFRDATCDFPGCNAPATHCDIDHIRAWEHGGRSTTENLHLLCKRHHMLKHATTWTPRRLPDGRVQWTSPAGFSYIVTRE